MRGWSNLYNSKLVNGGIRLLQNRIRQNDHAWTIDKGNYEQGWSKSDKTDEITAWTYIHIPLVKYFNLCEHN